MVSAQLRNYELKAMEMNQNSLTLYLETCAKTSKK